MTIRDFGEARLIGVLYGVSDADELSMVATAWREWGHRDDAVFIVPHGEVLARKWAPSTARI